MEKFNQLKAMIEAAASDTSAFYGKGNKAAGTRLRRAMQNIKVLAQEIRAEVTDQKNKAK